MVYGVSRIALPSCDLGDSMRLDRDFRMRSADFFAGPENQLAVPALENLLGNSGDSESETRPPQLFAPLVLLGPTGSGKSHLARGVVRHWNSNLGNSSAGNSNLAKSNRAKSEDSRVEYLTAIDFARQLRAAREEKKLDEFRDRLAGLQLFVLEDLHRLPLNLFVQRELRDTLDTLLDADAAIIVTSQSPPASIPDLEAGLRDRLSGGLTVRLQNPSFDTRVELLREVAAERRLTIDEQQLQQLAQRVEGPVPQLFRAIAEFELTQADSPAELSGIGDRPPLSFKQILAVVARYFSLTQAALRSPARRKSLVYARGIAVHLARSLTDLSYSQIGQSLGRRDHTTIMHANQSIEKQLTTDAATQQDLEELKRILTAV